MVVMMGVIALSLDLGSLMVARGKLQRSADAAAIAACWELLDEEAISGGAGNSVLETNARATALQYAALNQVLQQSPDLAQEDISLGFLSDPTDPTATLDTTGTNTHNAVWVRVRRTAVQNGSVQFFFARILGFDEGATEAEAMAAITSSFNGFQIPGDGGNLGILPFALDIDTWNDRQAGIGTDDWTWDEELGAVQSGFDGILEVNLYPQGTGSPGNRGTVDIGSNNNSTNDIARQITDGISPSDMEHHNGSLEFDENGEFSLNGDTGISAGVKDELQSIIGEPRIVPLFTEVNGPGNNAQYTIVAFVGIRILEVKLTGSQSSKRVIIQPATMTARGGIPTTITGRTENIYSPVWLIR